MPNSVATVRCAIYTRKSTEEGLDQEFNSLHASLIEGKISVAEFRVAALEHYLADEIGGGGVVVIARRGHARRRQ